MAIRAVVFDVGETLVDETAAWGDWADWLGVPRLTFFAALGGVIARGLDHRAVFDLVRPGLDLAAEQRQREVAGRRGATEARDLYPDALACLRQLSAAGFRIGIAANQPAATEAVVRSLGIPLALVASSERWGITKPDPAFFKRIADELGLPAAEIAYVGDRLDNDIAPAAAAGMAAIFIRRGPWALLQETDPIHATVLARATATISSLTELPALLSRLNAGDGPEPGVVEIHAYDPAWPETFERLAARIRAALDGVALVIEHIGSTAVPRLDAKPIIDIDVLVARDQVATATTRLATIGYVHEGDLGIAGREAFRSPSGTPGHHLYVCPEGSREFERHVKLRDYLRSHPLEAASYAELKRTLARRHGVDQVAYTNGKTDMIERMLEAARGHQGHRSTR